MAKQSSFEDLVPTEHLNTLAIPNDPALKLAFEVFKPSAETKRLLSEQGRNVYPERFIENPSIGTLVDLCIRALAHSFGPDPLPIIADEPLLMQVHYDALDVEMPLENCWHIEEERFWKRLVLAKHRDKSLALKSDVNWKNIGVSLKFVELIEECAVEYWPEDDMKNLAIKVKDFITELHIKRLQSLNEESFEKYFSTELEVITEAQLELQNHLSDKKAQREKARQELREAKQKAEEAKEAKLKKRALRRAKLERAGVKLKKRRVKSPKNVFETELIESEDDPEDKIIDKLNKLLHLNRIQRYDYPPEHCHHIDLGFVQYFTNLETFHIEFLGPKQNSKYHKRHLNFSDEDIKKLANGINCSTKLRIFRLRNSRMDTKKLLTLCRTLSKLENLEILDFGYDNLSDDCGLAFTELFKNSTSLRHLELESNNFGEEVLLEIGKALQSYSNAQLEYLGLARNPTTDKALHTLISHIIGTKHVSSLNLKGAKHLSEIGLSCCIAHELLLQHSDLTKPYLCAVKISPSAANEILKAMVKNKNILEFICLGCDLDEESDIDIKVILKRNRYIVKNSYLGDENITKEEMEEWRNRNKNPILLKVLAEREAINKCFENRPEEYIPSALASLTSSQASLPDQRLSEYSSFHPNIRSNQVSSEPFNYAADQFDEKQFLNHIHQPGPGERYYYFKMSGKKYMPRDDIKNISVTWNKEMS